MSDDGRVVALLRGINVGKGPRIKMPDLREVVMGLGHTDVATHLQSGNVVLVPGHTGSTAELARELQGAVARRFEVAPVVVVFNAPEWHQLVGANPYQAQDDPTRVHAAAQQDPITAKQRNALAELLADSQRAGCPDHLTIADRVVYLRTPNGMGRSPLAEKLSRVKAAGQGHATARNWRSVLAIQAMLTA